MRLVMFGPPGSGKGTQAVILSQNMGMPHISTGQIFRDTIKSKTDFGKKIDVLLAGGNLVPDDLVIEIVTKRISENDCQENGFILDGFPRTTEQARALDNWLKENSMHLDRVIHLSISESVLAKRLSGRRFCDDCGSHFNTFFMPPKVEGTCDNCDGDLCIRADDSPDAIKHRLEIDQTLTRPLYDFYSEKELILETDGDGPVDSISKFICQHLGN